MIALRKAVSGESDLAMRIIDMAKEHLKSQNIDQWQSGYPDLARIESDIREQKGYFVTEDGVVLGYLCVDFEGEPAYEKLEGSWHTEKPYVVVHRMAFTDEARGKGISRAVFNLVEELSMEKGVFSFRVDTDADNGKMRHVLSNNGFQYCGTIWFDDSAKIAFDKALHGSASR